VSALRNGRVVDCLLRCVDAAKGPSFGLLASSSLVVRVGRSVLDRWEKRSNWISSGFGEKRASLVSTCRLLRSVSGSETGNVTSGGSH